MANINDIIKNMSSSVRSKAEAFASAKGISLEAAVAQQLSTELSDADLEGVAGGTLPVEDNIEYGDGSERNIEYAARLQ